MFQCDICGGEGKRYQITYEDGVRILDRCEKHAKALEKFRDEPGEWLTSRPAKSSFRKSSPAELRLALARTKED